jgi:hypothetical protein
MELIFSRTDSEIVAIVCRIFDVVFCIVPLHYKDATLSYTDMNFSLGRVLVMLSLPR